MTDVRKLLARLNPSVASFGGGRGGIPELTPQDIAAAIGYCPATLGRELMCRMWWPDGAALTAQQLDRELKLLLLGEWAQRARKLEAAKLARVLAEDGHGSARRADSEVLEARGNMWPKYARHDGRDAYGLLRRAVVDEMAAPGTCPHCGGRGFKPNKAAVHIECVPCAGRGWVSQSNRSRADAMQINESTYRRVWLPVYEWLMQHCVDAEADARKALAKALGCSREAA